MKEEENKTWFVHIEFLVILITILTGFYLLDLRIERQVCKTDRLYEMFIDLLREGRNKK